MFLLDSSFIIRSPLAEYRRQRLHNSRTIPILNKPDGVWPIPRQIPQICKNRPSPAQLNFQNLFQTPSG
jgi:hypothetical protein